MTNDTTHLSCGSPYARGDCDCPDCSRFKVEVYGGVAVSDKELLWRAEKACWRAYEACRLGIMGMEPGEYEAAHESLKGIAEELRAEADRMEARTKLRPGIYRLHWKSSAGGGTSVASVGVMANGDRWMAPINWSFPPSLADHEKCWNMVERAERIA